MVFEFCQLSASFHTASIENGRLTAPDFVVDGLGQPLLSEALSLGIETNEALGEGVSNRQTAIACFAIKGARSV